MGVSHWGIQEGQEFRIDTPSLQLLYSLSCKQQGTHCPPMAEAGRRRSRMRGLKSARKPRLGIWLTVFFRTVLQGLGLAPLCSDQESGIVCLCPWAVQPVTDSSKGCEWKWAWSDSRIWGCVSLNEAQLEPMPQTQLSPQHTQGRKEAASFWFMESLSPQVGKTLKVILCLSTFRDRRFTASWGSPLHLGELWQLERTSLPWAQSELFFPSGGPL